MFANSVIKHSLAMTTVSNHVKKSNTAISEHVARRVSEHLMHSFSVVELDELLLSENVANQKNLKLYVTIARETKQGLLAYNKNNDETDNSFEKYHEINNGFYLQYFTGDSAKAQAIFYTYAQKYLKLCQQDLQKTEKDFSLYQSVKQEGDYWLYNNEYNGSDIHGAIYVLSQYSDDISLALIKKLAKIGSAVAILNIHTENDKQAQDILMELVYKNQYALSRLKQAFDNNEFWTKALIWYQDDNQIYISNNKNIGNQVSVYDAISLGNKFAMDTLPMKNIANQSEEEIAERMAIIKRILHLDLNLPIYTERDNDVQDTIEILPYQEHYSFKPILVELEQQVFNKVQEALSKYPKWNRATILFGECYKLGIGTKQSLMDALACFTEASLGDNYLKIINCSDPCVIDNFETIEESLESIVGKCSINLDLKNAQITQKQMLLKSDIIKLKVNKALFYFKDALGLGYEVVEIFNTENNLHNSHYAWEIPPPLHEKLPAVMKSLITFNYVAGIIATSGDVLYLYEEGYCWSIIASLQGLYDIGEYDMIQMLLYTYAVFHDPNIDTDSDEFKTIDSDKKIEKIHDYLSKNIEDFDTLKLRFRLTKYDYDDYEKRIYNSKYDVMDKIIAHIRSNINDYVTDENGEVFDLSFTGVYKNDKYELTMHNGKPHGDFKIFNPRDSVAVYEGTFEHGFLTNYSYSNYLDYKNTYTKYICEYEQNDNEIIVIETKYFADSEQIAKISRKPKYYSRISYIGEQKEWYENGQLKSCIFYENGKETRWQRYYENGQKIE